MKKLLAIGGVAVVGFLVFLMLQLGSSAESAPAPAPDPQKPVIEKVTGDKARSAAIPVADQKPDDGKPKKLDPQSDEFFLQFDEMVPKKLTMAAAPCYTGGINRVGRNQHLKLAYDNVIKDGWVTVANLKKLPDSNLNNPEMEQCMMNAVAATRWRNDALPDGVWGDQLKITPERGMKKYTKENMEYEGDPNGLPVGKAVMKPNQPPPVSDTATRSGAEAAEAAGR